VSGPRSRSVLPAAPRGSAEPLRLQPNRLLININRNIAHGKLVIHLALSALSDGIKHMNVILYSKPGCHLCEGMQEKLSAVQSFWPFELEIRDILTNPEWFERYQYTIPVIQVGNKILPSQPPHIPVQQLQRLLVRMTDAAKGTTP
jgi:Glutaredoxin-like domain (DUF836)